MYKHIYHVSLTRSTKLSRALENENSERREAHLADLFMRTPLATRPQLCGPPPGPTEKSMKP